MAKPKTMHSVLMATNAVLLAIGLGMLGMAFASNLAHMAQHPLFATGMNCLGMAAVSAVLLFLTGRAPETVKIDRRSGK